MKRISFIILSWNSQSYLEACFDSLVSKCEGEDIPYEVITVDNGSTDTSPAIIGRYCTKYPGKFSLIHLPNNHGTTYTRNLGLKKAIGPYVCVLDSDTEFLDDGSLRDVLDTLDRRPEIGIIAPRIVLPDGSVQNSVKRFPSFLRKLGKLVPLFCHIDLPETDCYETFPFQSETSVDSAISACWFLKKGLIDTVGFLDEKIFYAPEDLDFSLRVRLAGRQIVYYPGLAVLHCTQQISHRNPLSILSLKHLLGLIYYFNKHGGWFSTRKIYERIDEGVKSLDSAGRSRERVSYESKPQTHGASQFLKT